MGGSNPRTLFSRLVDVALPTGGYVMTLYEAYFDESGCHDGSRLLAVGGYLARSDRARLMDRRWRTVLQKRGLPYFHMVDCAPGNAPFDKLHRDERAKIVRELIQLIKRYTAIGFVAVVNPRRFEERDGLPDPYSYCVSLCVMGLAAWLSDKEPAKVAFFFEAGHQNGTKAHREIERWAKGVDGQRYYAAHIFAKKQEVRLLQAGDLLSWQAAKFMKDKINQTRPPRGDFLSLMKHPHAFSYVVLQNDILVNSIDNGPHIEDPLRDNYLRAVFADDKISDDIVNHFHLMMADYNRRGKIEFER